MADAFVIRDVAPSDLDWVHHLNAEHETELSSLRPGELAGLLGEAAIARVVEPQAAFLIAMDETAVYDSPNFLWFRERYARFLYVDRIAVAVEQRRQGLARRLYDDVMRLGRAAGYPMLCAEVNLDPPNPASIAFHERLGFDAVGETYLEDRNKTLRYFARPLRVA